MASEKPGDSGDAYWKKSYWYDVGNVVCLLKYSFSQVLFLIY